MRIIELENRYTGNRTVGSNPTLSGSGSLRRKALPAFLVLIHNVIHNLLEAEGRGAGGVSPYASGRDIAPKALGLQRRAVRFGSIYALASERAPCICVASCDGQVRERSTVTRGGHTNDFCVVTAAINATLSERGACDAARRHQG